jgi:hypothetical protein
MKLRLLPLIAKLLGIQFKVGGLPYGANPHQLRIASLSQSPQP